MSTTNNPDQTLADLRLKRMRATDAVIELYEAVREAKNNDYSYREIETHTGFPRGTIQNIIAGTNPRFTIE